MDCRTVIRFGVDQISAALGTRFTTRVRLIFGAIILVATSLQLIILTDLDTGSMVTAIKSHIPISVTVGYNVPSGGTYEDDKLMIKQPVDVDSLLAMPLRERLLAAFPYDPNFPMEKNIIQTSKDKEFTNKEVESWQVEENLEHGFNYTMFDDQMAYRLLLREFGQAFPEIIETYNLFPRVILRVDFFRYASMFLLGGTYSDTDTLSTRPLNQWITYQNEILGVKNKVGAVVGIEAECDCQDWQNVYTRRVQFCQWTLQARKHHPMYAMLLANIVGMMTDAYDRNTKILKVGDKDYDFSPGKQEYYNGIMELTGPGMFTSTVFEYINTLDPVTSINPNDQDSTFASLRYPDPENKRQSVRAPQWSKFGWENVTKIKEPVLINDDFLILPEKYWNGKKEENSQCLVQHMYHGSWKSSKGGITDP